MCKCTTQFQSPYCGRPGCEFPEQKEYLNTSIPEYRVNGTRGFYYVIESDGVPMSAADVVAELNGVGK